MRKTSVDKILAQRWLSAAKTLELGRREQQSLKKIGKSPRSFLALAELFFAHGRAEQGLQLLVEVLECHPQENTLRVVLARELFRRGMVDSCWDTLQAAPAQMLSNALAQRILFRLAILRRDGNHALAIAEHMGKAGLLDDETRKLAAHLSSGQLEVVRDDLLYQFKRQGVDPYVTPQATEQTGGSATTQDSRESVKTEPLSKGIEGILRKPWIHCDLDGFHVVPLQEVFQPEDLAISSDAFEVVGGMELDSVTMAEIYADQGHYGKALAVYRGLQRGSPRSERFQKRIVELIQAKEEQERSDYALDPAIADDLTAVEDFKVQERFYKSLMERL